MIDKSPANHSMTLAEAVSALKPLNIARRTKHGETLRPGFFFPDAVLALGGMKQASETVAFLLCEGLLDSTHVQIDGEVHTLYYLTGAPLPNFH